MGDVGSLTRRKKNVKASAHCKQLSAMLNSGRSLRTGTVTRFAFAALCDGSWYAVLGLLTVQRPSQH